MGRYEKVGEEKSELFFYFFEARNLLGPTAKLTGGTMTHAIFAHEGMRSIMEVFNRPTALATN